MPSFIPTQPPDASTGARYARAYKYAFAMLKPNEIVSNIDPSDTTSYASSLVTDGRFVVLTLPQQLSMREPYMTAVTVMQDGGKVIESKGQVLKMATISGTTGFLPPVPGLQQQQVQTQPPYGQLIPNVNDLDSALGAFSGYLAFMNLRYLFRMYGEQRRQGDLSAKLHFFDYKNDDFWRIEPESFDMTRSSRKPMSYDYNIAFKCIEYSELTTIKDGDTNTNTDSVLPAFVSMSGTAQVATSNVANMLAKSGGFIHLNPPIMLAVSRMSDLLNSGLNAVNSFDAVVQRSFQFALNKVAAIVGVFQAAHDVFNQQLQLLPAILAQESAALSNLFDTINEFAPDNIAQELNAWGLEMQSLSDNMWGQINALVGSQAQRDVGDTNTRFSQGRMRQGATTDILQEPSGGAGSPDVNPFIGASGLSLVTDPDSLASTTQFATVIVHSGEDIYALARRTLGSITRAIDLILVNRLEFPFIVSDAMEKPPNTLAWGDSILVPMTATNASSMNISDSADPSVVPTTSGTVTTSGLPSQLIDDTATWLTDQWIGYSVVATTGGSTQTLICSGNTGIQLTLNGSWTITITPNTTTYAVKYNTFNPRRPVTPDARAYGTSLLVVFDSDGRCDFAIGASGGLASVSGLDNLIQAITLRSRCPIGEHPFHRTYGMPAPVGRPAIDSVFVLSAFFARRSLLSDPRISKVRNIHFDQVGDTLMMSAEIQPAGSQTSRPITTQVGS